MVEWSREYYIDPNTTGLNAVYRSVTGTAPEGDNNVDGLLPAETTEAQATLMVSGRQIRGSFQTLRIEQSERNSKFFLLKV